MSFVLFCFLRFDFQSYFLNSAINLFYFIFGHATWHLGSLFPDQQSNPQPPEVEALKMGSPAREAPRCSVLILTPQEHELTIKKPASVYVSGKVKCNSWKYFRK